MRNILSWPFVLALVMGVSFGEKSMVLAHEIDPGVVVGARLPVFALCDARGASAVVRVALETGSTDATNREFSRQAHLPTQFCVQLPGVVILTVTAIGYAGETRGLHVVVVEFGRAGYVVLTGYDGGPPGTETLAGFTI